MMISLLLLSMDFEEPPTSTHELLILILTNKIHPFISFIIPIPFLANNVKHWMGVNLFYFYNSIVRSS